MSKAGSNTSTPMANGKNNLSWRFFTPTMSFVIAKSVLFGNKTSINQYLRRAMKCQSLSQKKRHKPTKHALHNAQFVPLTT
jgi:hypothetical protein